ncbi:putative phosphatase regulatory subunit-domain-containing protein [Flagelloscypha sp. PMI_526]|nr:putative phosphatase regulatory subunit-domain-containing protein [Flagelloscypha sp. PMI_526]
MSPPVSLPARSSSHERSHDRRSYLVQNRHLPAGCTDDKWPTTFPSLSSISKRRRTSFFKIGGDSSSDESEDEFPPRLLLKRTPPGFAPGLWDTTPVGRPPSIPEISSPQSSPAGSLRCDDSLTFQSEGPNVVRTSSHSAILLANGKPLKSSLKSSTKSTIGKTSINHGRIHGAPSKPHSGVTPGADEDSQGRSHNRITPPPLKNVRFADILASVRLFHRFASPASILLLPNSVSENDDDIEPSSDEGDSFNCGLWSTPWSSQSTIRSEPVPFFQIDSLASTPIPLRSANWTMDRYIVLESLILVGGVSLSKARPMNNDDLRLAGTVLVRNVSFEKKVDIRFTLDNWDTVSEVGRCDIHQAETELNDHGWDRFSFTIRLCDYVRSLPSKTLFLAARFQAENSQEWWDNNSGSNYTMRFREVTMRRSVPNEPLASARTIPTISPKTEILVERLALPPSISQEHPIDPNYTPASISHSPSSPPLTIPSTPELLPIITNFPVTYLDLDPIPPCPPNSPNPSISPTSTVPTDTEQLCRLGLSKFATPPSGCSVHGSFDCFNGFGSGSHSNLSDREPQVGITQEKFLNDDISCSSSDDDLEELTSCSSEDENNNDDGTPPITPLEAGDFVTNTKVPEFVWPELPAFEDLSTSDYMPQGSIDSSHHLYKMFVQRWCFANTASSYSV